MVKSADRVFQVLEFIVGHKEGLSHKELSRGLDIPKSSLSALLSNLVSREYLTYNSVNKRYRLGPKILTLAGRHLSDLDIAQQGQPIVHKVMLRTEESAELAILSGHRIQIVCKVDCFRPLQSVIKLGDTAPIYATAAGKAILAFLPEGEIEEYLSSVELRQITKKTITDKHILKRQLGRIRSGTIAYSHEELNEGLVAMAMPVFNLNGSVVSSIVVPIPTLRFTTKSEKTIAKVLREASRELSHQLGFDGFEGAASNSL
jgi:DNA-binding IclR family transcriptional regulator